MYDYRLYDDRVSQARCVEGDGADATFYVTSATGRTPRRLPLALRDEFGETLVSSLQAAYGAPVDPRSGWIIGGRGELETLTELSLRQLQRTMLREDWVLWVGDVPAVDVRSAAAWCSSHAVTVSAGHRIGAAARHRAKVL